MKFLCDRCKTRYSIGDDRVRGKILKIRCKNCANVITVREGMEGAAVDDGATTADGGAGRVKKPTTMAPPIEATAPAPAPGRNALGAAFASAMSNPAAKPPAALEEEWYVSIDGEQSGPYSLAEAQRWVATKAFDAELHCWSEGFDDWLPVDKVSHFRGLRKKPPAPMAPPPIPRVGGGGSGPQSRLATAAAAPAVEDEPKPLFAATMASLEKSAAQALPSVDRSPNPRATPPGGVPAAPIAKAPTNGTKNGSGAVAAVAKVAPRGFGTASKVPGFDFEVGESATQITTPPFNDEPPTEAEPVASARAAGLKAAPMTPAATPFPTPFAQGAKPNVPLAALKPASDSFAGDESEDEGDLDIGEVSRVVNLGDLIKNGPQKKRPRTNPGQPVPVGLAPLIGRASGVNQAIGGGQTAGIARVDLNTGLPIAPLAPGVDPTSLSPLDPNYVPDSAMVTPTQTPKEHNKRMALMLGVGVVLLVGIVIAVVVVVNGQGDNTQISGLHVGPDYSTERPEDVQRSTTGEDKNPTEHPTNPNPQNPFLRPTQKPRPYVPPVDTHSSLPDPAEEVDDVTQKNSGLTGRCFRLAGKGVNAITVGNVKRVVVIMNVSAEGAVTSVSLDGGHQTDALGACLVPVMKTWKFKPNKGGTVKFTVVPGAS